MRSTTGDVPVGIKVVADNPKLVDAHFVDVGIAPFRELGIVPTFVVFRALACDRHIWALDLGLNLESLVELAIPVLETFNLNLKAPDPVPGTRAGTGPRKPQTQ